MYNSRCVTGPLGTASDHTVEPLGPVDGQASPAPQPGSTAVAIQGGVGDPALEALVSTATTVTPRVGEYRYYRDAKRW